MRKRFISVDRSTPQMFPARIDDYLPEDHLARFVVDIVEQLDLRGLVEAYSGRGSSAYHPAMMVALLFYGYATGTFSSRKLERATYDSIAYRYICANRNPDHDSINSFRKRFRKELEGLFVEVLVIAREVGMLKMGTVSLDGTKIRANASRHKALSWKRALEIEKQLKEEVKELMRLAEEADNSSLSEDVDIPGELRRRESRLEVIREARKEIEARAERSHKRKLEEHKEKMGKRKRYEEETGKKPRGREPKEPEGGPGDKDQVNLVDKDSRIMQTSGGFEQSYNAQASVEVESGLIVTRHVTQNTNDKKEIEPALEQLREQEQLLGEAENLLADAGYFSGSNVEACGREGVRPFISTSREKHNEPFWERFAQGEQEDSGEPVSAVEDMKRRMKTSEGKGLYAKRKSTIEPVFGVIKQVMGFRQFLLRGVEAVQGEWNLVCIGYNLKKMYALRG